MKKLNYIEDYPLSEKRIDLIKTPTGKSLHDITMEKIIEGKVDENDCRISSETLEYQAQIAQSASNKQLAENFRRAAELTKFSDERVLKIYSALRPYRSTKEELIEIAEELKANGAVLNSQFVMEAIDAYEKRRKFKGDK